MKTVAVIMAGGIGERFWPYSRKSRPKQLLTLFGKKPMIQTTVDRLKPVIKPEDVYISTNTDLAKRIKKVLPKVKYVLEPMGRNTAACIGLSAARIIRDHGDAVMFIETADHVYNNTKDYISHIRAGVESALDNSIAMIGIKPTEPHTGYGYIQRGKRLNKDGIAVYSVKQFKEKPDLKTAKKYVKAGSYYWNSGMFISKASVMLEEIDKHMPKLSKALLKISNDDFSEKTLIREFRKLESVSIDYGIMEKSKNVIVIDGNMHWDDVGDWNALSRVFDKDKKGNVVIGKHIVLDTDDSIIVGDKPIATLGLKDIVIIETEKAVLVMSKDKASDLKKLVKELPERLIR